MQGTKAWERGYLLDRDDARVANCSRARVSLRLWKSLIARSVCKVSPGVNAFFSNTLLYNSLPALSKRGAVYLTDVSNNEGLVLYPIYCR